MWNFHFIALRQDILYLIFSIYTLISQKVQTWVWFNQDWFDTITKPFLLLIKDFLLIWKLSKCNDKTFSFTLTTNKCAYLGPLCAFRVHSPLLLFYKIDTIHTSRLQGQKCGGGGNIIFSSCLPITTRSLKNDKIYLIKLNKPVSSLCPAGIVPWASSSWSSKKLAIKVH